jgi:hypothetical protein
MVILNILCFMSEALVRGQDSRRRLRSKALTLVEEDCDPDLVAAAQEMPGRRKERFGRPEVRRIIHFDQGCLAVPVRTRSHTYA